MKRTLQLVEYSSSEDEVETKATPPKPEVKKRKLPALATNLLVPTPVDNPALHQGRTRSAPHVEGQFASFVYVPFKIARGSALDTLLDKIFQRAKELVPTLQPITAGGESTTKERELHVSLTRPVYLRAHQRDEFKTAVKTVYKQQASFAVSFTNFAELTNDEHTRTFLTIEIGAGHRELENLCTALAPTLRSYRQKEFYDQPRFHASVAWALLSRTPGEADTPLTTTSKDVSSPSSESPVSTGTLTSRLNSISADDSPPATFQTISGFPQDLVPTLEREFGPTLCSRHTSTFDAESLCVKIGKDNNCYKLQNAP